jgi:D-3-phosphoglycerate dehydrogenase / 2-oxoglutarate reductase
MAIKILANDGIHEDGLLLLDEAGFDVQTEKIPQDKLASEIAKFDVLIVRSATKVRKDIIDAGKNLKIIARGGVGMDNIDVEYAESKGIKVINTPAASSQAVAELAFAHIFSIARGLQKANREMPERGSSDFKGMKKDMGEGMQLRGKTLGIIGFGRIGQALARMGLGLGLNVMPADLHEKDIDLNIDLFAQQDVRVNVKLHVHSINKVLAMADILSFHIPGGTEPVIGAAEIAKMKDNVILVNAARGGVIDEQALLDGLNSGKIYGAGLDVFEDENTPRAELMTHPKISLTPHIGAATIEAQGLIGLELAERIMEHLGV